MRKAKVRHQLCSTQFSLASCHASTFSERKSRPTKSRRQLANDKLHLTMATSNEGGLSKYVTLVSSDGFEFVVLREAACKSGAIKRMLDPKSESYLSCQCAPTP